MGKTQRYMGNPEQKLVWLTEDFVGGINLTFSDDATEDNEFRQLTNYDLDSRGSLEKRKGYSTNKALTELLCSDADYNLPMFYTNKAQVYSSIVLFKLLENTNNVWNMLADASSLSVFQETITDDLTLKVLVIANKTSGNSEAFVNTYVIKPTEVVKTKSKTTLPFRFNCKDNLMNVSFGEDSKKLYITSNDVGLAEFNKDDNTWTYCSSLAETTNSAYKPNSLEVRKVGFNVLGDDPLTWIDSSTLTTSSIQGVYLTTVDRIPIQVIPTSYTFQVNIIYTGSKSDFTIELKDTSKETDNVITCTSTKNETLSTVGLSVYDIVITVQPTSEIEINITMTDEASVSKYRDYYSIGVVDPLTKAVEKLNVGNYTIIEMGQRLVYYDNNTIWFSEINRYNYIPNYNYIILPLRNTDAITKIIFFRKNYIVFTREEIWRIDGSFGANDFGLYQVNNTIGCIAPNSVCRVNDKLLFLSQVGLRSLEYDRFLEGLQNVKAMDDKVKDIIYKGDNVYSILHNDQYCLMNNLRGERKTVYMRYQDYELPDTLRYYSQLDAYVSDNYPLNLNNQKVYPHFLIMLNGDLFTFMDDKIWKYGDDYSDFNLSYPCLLETAGVNCGYPLHEKKIKTTILKTTGGELTQPIYARVYADGTLIHDYRMNVVDINELGEVIYDVVEEPSVVIPPTIAKLATAVLGEAKLGYNPMVVRKLNIPAKCRNITITLETNSIQGFSVLSLGYLYKLRKIKE